MAEAPKDTPPHGAHPDELRSDLDLLIQMAKDVEHDEDAIHHHLESLKSKLDEFIHRRRTKSGGGAAS
jgi:hypothetical protein